MWPTQNCEQKLSFSIFIFLLWQRGSERKVLAEARPSCERLHRSTASHFHKRQVNLCVMLIRCNWPNSSSSDVLSLSFFPLLPLQFLHEAFSQAGKHNYSMHVPNLIRFFLGVCFSCVCFRWCFFVRPVQSKCPKSTRGDLNLFKLLRKLTLNSWFGLLSYWGLKRMADINKLYLNVTRNTHIWYSGVYLWIIWSKSKFNS